MAPRCSSICTNFQSKLPTTTTSTTHTRHDHVSRQVPTGHVTISLTYQQKANKHRAAINHQEKDSQSTLQYFFFKSLQHFLNDFFFHLVLFHVSTSLLLSSLLRQFFKTVHYFFIEPNPACHLIAVILGSTQLLISMCDF